MGYGFPYTCRLETRKIVLLIGLILVSVLVIQHFELPHRNSLLSLLSTGKSVLIFYDTNGGDNGDSGLKENFMPESTLEMYHNATIETIGKSIGLAPERAIDTLDSVSDISPSVTYREDSDALGNSKNVVSPPESVLVESYSPLSSTMNKNEANISQGSRDSAINNSPPLKEMPDKTVASVLSISQMYEMLLNSRVSSFSKRPVWLSPADQELLDARFQIENTSIIRDYPGLYGPIYRNLSTFVRSYELMEQKLKIYIYRDGKRPVFHQPRLKGIYASEGWFMKLLQASNRYITTNSGEAHLFYLPFSSQLLVDHVYVPDSHSFHEIVQYLKNYLDTINGRYPFWNRTNGEDHFLVACHDWAPAETKKHMANCIRALCNADTKEGFQFGKDVSLPETYVHSPQNPSKEFEGKSPSQRKFLAFFAGQMHGYVRPMLLKHWENRDPDMKIFGKMKKASYVRHMRNSKYCICAKGYEVNSPRVVEAIIHGCVPVIISDNFVPPFFEILKWDSFAVFVFEKDIPDLKNILLSIPEKRYVVMQQRVNQVKKHFLWHNSPVKYDIFHMILHSLWYNRVFRIQPH